MLLRALRGPSIAALFLLSTGPAAAVPTQYFIYLDRDNNAATGCTVTVPSGSLSGVEEILQTTVNTTGPGSAVVDQVTQSICTAPPSTFSAPVVIDAGDWPVGFANGVGGQNVTETYWPLPNPKPLFVRVVVVAQPQTGAPDEMAVTAPGGTTPIVIQLGSVIEVPTLSAWGAAGLALVLFGSGLWLIQKKRRRSAAVLLLVFGLATAVYAATVTLDGQIGDWAPGTQVATDSAADGSLGSNMVALFAQVDNANDRLAFRIDGSLQFNQPPVANDQSPAAGNEDTAQNLTLTGSDGDGDPLTFSIVTPPTGGSLSALTNPTATSVDVTYTPNLNFNGADSFVFQVADGFGGTDTGTVTLAVTPVDDDPTAVNDAATVNEDSGANAIAVLSNDTDPDAGPISITAVTQPANGVVVITGGGTGLTYQPNANYCNNPPGTALDTFTYTLTPGGSVATVTMTVSCVDDPPTAVNDAATVTEDDPATAIPVLTNDTDLDAGPISITSVTQPANGTVVITGGGTGLTYQPNANYCNNPPGTTLDTFTYTLTPGGSVATVTMTVTCVDDSPVAVADAATVTEDDPATAVPVLTNDTDADGGPISITSVTQPANGTVVITGGGTGLTYQPNANYCNNPPGTTLDTFTYTLTPGGSVATVTMTVTCVDDNPVAVNDAATVNEDSGANAVAVLANDTDVDAGPISITSVTQPANGTVVITGGGTGLTYAPNSNYCNNPPGTTLDTFTYTLTPGGSVATVTMTVTCIDDPPAAVNDAATVNEDSGANAVAVLANDVDNDGGPISITSVTQPANGVVVITGGGTGLTYAPNANYCNNPPGTTLDTFTYTLTPGGSSATVTMTVTCLNDAPALDLDANDSGGTAGADYAVTFTEGDPPALIEDALDATATDIDNANLASMTVTITNVQNVGSEILSADVTGTSITANYVPATGILTLAGPDTVANFQTVLRKVRYSHVSNAPTGAPARIVTFVANDGATNSNTATSTVTVVPVDSNPTAVADSATVNEDSGATAINVLANDTDPDGGPISITSVTQPANGTVVITGGGTGLTYQPNANYCNNPPGTTLSTFTYTLTPGGSSTTVTVTVTCVDDNPVAVADAATVNEDSGATAIPVLANDTDVDGGPISITSVTQPANGTVVITGGGTGLTYQPNANYCNNPPGTTLSTFTYTLTPGGSSTTVTVTVTCVDDNPVAVADSATLTEDDPATAINVLANDTDVDGGPISITSVTQPVNGTVVITGGGTGLTYQPNANYCNNPPGTTLSTFTYTLTPGGSSTTVTVTVTCVDDPPVAVADSATVVEDSGANAINVLANDTDPDAGPISITSVTQPLNGTVVITGGGTGLTYQPNANYCNNPPGTTLSTFTYTLTPGGSVATVTVTVTCVNDPPVADNDTFDFIGNTELRVDTGAVATPHALETTGTTFGVIDGDSDPVEGDAIAVSSITVGACTDASAPFDCTDAAVGRVQMQANGRFSFEPAPGDTGASESFTYILTDNGTPSPASAPAATVTLTRLERVWYVKNDSTVGGLGRSFDPFDTLAEAQTASVANDYIFVYFGDGATTGQAAGITLKNGQHLIGEHAGLSIPVNLNANGSPTVLHAGTPGSRPLLDDTTAGNPEGVAATDAIPTEIVGLNLAGNVNGIDLTTTVTFAGSGSLEIRDNVVRSTVSEGIDVNVNGTGANVVNLSIHDNNITAGVNGIDVQRTAGTVRVTGFDDNVVTGNSGGIGMVLNNVIFDSTPGNPINAVLGGTTVIGASGNGVGTQGLILGNVTGELTFNDLDVFNDAGIGLGVLSTGALNAGAGTGFRVAVVSGVSTIDSNGGPGVSITNASVSLPLLSYESTNSTTTGLSLVNAFGGVGNTVFGAASGLISDPVGASGVAVNIDGGNGNITIGIPVTNNSGNAVVVTNRTGDLVSFAAAINETGSGLTHTNNTGAAISYSGGITASTGANTAFNATGGGTLGVTGATNTLTTTSGTALNVANTTIGASGLTFRSIASNGAASGIVLNNTGATAGLTVSGTGGAGTGGTIQNSTGPGVSLTATRAVSLSSMNIQSGGDDGINGLTVNGITLSGVSVTNNGNSTTDEGIELDNPVGAMVFTNVTATGNAHNNFYIDDADNVGGNSTLAISGGSFSTTGASGNHGGLMEIRGTAILGLSTIAGATFSNNFSIGLQVTTGDTGTISDLTVSGNTFSDTGTGNSQEISMDFAQAQNSSLTVKVLNNNIQGHNSHGMNFFSGAPPSSGTYNARIENNTIGTAATVNSGSAIGNCMRINMNGGAASRILVNNNVLRQCPNGRGIEVIGRNGTGGADVTITNNDVNPQDTSGFPLAAIFVQSNCVGVCNTVRADVRGNTVPAGTAFDILPTFITLAETSGAPSPPGTSTLELVDTAPASASCTAQLTSTNTGSASANAGCALIAGPINTPP